MNADLANLDYAEQLYAAFQRDPASVSAEWRRLFESTADAEGANGRWQPGPSFSPRNVFNAGDKPSAHDGENSEIDPLNASLHERLNELIRNYRVRGHKIAAIDPLGVSRPTPPELELDYYRFTERELDLLTGGETFAHETPLTICKIIERLRTT